LDVLAKVPGADAESFATITMDAKRGCPVSLVLNADITMDEKLA
jgi:osmotically inducible protein OsmC